MCPHHTSGILFLPCCDIPFLCGCLCLVVVCAALGLIPDSGRRTAPAVRHYLLQAPFLDTAALGQGACQYPCFMIFLFQVHSLYVMTYRTLADIQLEIARLRQEVSSKEDEISNLWNNTFHQTDDKELKTPTQRILQYANTCAGVFDGALLGWRLYRRLGGTFSLFGNKRRRR